MYEPQSPCLNTLWEFRQNKAFGAWLWNIRTSSKEEKPSGIKREFNVNNYIQSPMFEHFF